jgi:hypothetical protein
MIAVLYCPERTRARGTFPELVVFGALSSAAGIVQQELLHLQVVAEVLATFLMVIVLPPFIMMEL